MELDIYDYECHLFGVTEQALRVRYVPTGTTGRFLEAGKGSEPPSAFLPSRHPADFGVRRDIPANFLS